MALSTLNPLVVVHAHVEFKIRNGCVELFDSGCQEFTIGNAFSQSFGDLFDLPAGDVDTQVSMEAITNASMIYFMANAAIQIKLVPQGATPENTQPMTLLPGYPSMVSLQNIVGIYVSNPTDQSSKVLCYGVGTVT
jgi:hypothetical protein